MKNRFTPLIRLTRFGATAAYRRMLSCIAALALLMFTPLAAMADEPRIPYDGRFNGYGQRWMTLDVSAGLMWLLLVGLGIICLGVLFKNAKRTHLD